MSEREKTEREKAVRITIELPVVPYSVRAFVEKVVRDEQAMLSFVEAPAAALRGAGVPIDVDRLTRADYDRLIGVLGRLRNLVASGEVAKDFRFENVFTIASDAAYQEQHSSSEAYAKVNFDHSTEGQSAENKTSTEGGIKDNFSRSGFGVRNVEEIVAPLMSPGALAEIAALMHASMHATFPQKTK